MNVRAHAPQADRCSTSLGVNYPVADNAVGLAAPLFALAGTTTNFSLSFEGVRMPTA